ncbi:MAG: hypothetical protein LBH14_08470 [Desulfobulbaceae bacterium]|jgi:hypothetical protein|nr:hypothetical protein [Desulfobulbaceae bacterium]
MRTLILICLLSSVLIFCSADIIHAKDFTPQDTGSYIKTNSFILNGAARDISDNISVWLKLKQTADGGSGEMWTIVLGDKIPSQPIAVIDVLSLIPHDKIPLTDEIRDVCPRPFMEGAQEYEMEDWMNRAIATLSSFTMNDPKKEKIRQECLANIKQSLANKDKWSKPEQGN